MIESTTNPALAGYLVRYQHPNHQSSSTLETDDVGAVISYEEYHPYGTTSYQAMEKPVRAAAKRYRYTGMERDEETGLSYHSARYYISWLGRWLSPDPIGIGDGVNVYGYCHNNPVTYLDTNGRQTKSPKTKAVTETKGAKAAEAPKESSFWADFGTVLLNKVVNTIMSIGDNPNYEGKMYSPKDKPVSAEQAAKYHPYNTVPETLKLLDPKTHIEGAAEGIGNTAGFIIAVTKKDGKEAANTFFDAVGTVSTIGGLYKNMVKTTTKSVVTPSTGPLKVKQVDLVAGEKGLSNADKNVTFYTVQNEYNAARLRTTGAPWPSAPTRAHLGEGVYSWGSLEEAHNYLDVLKRHGGSSSEGLDIVSFSIPKYKFDRLNKFIVPENEIGDAWLSKHSKIYGEGIPHNFDYIRNNVGNGGYEHFFDKKIYDKLKFN